MKIKVVSSHYGELEQKDIVVNNLTDYCTRHGYELVLNFSNDISLKDTTGNMWFYWQKIHEIKKNLVDCDYLFVSRYRYFHIR